MELGLLSFENLASILWGRRWTTLVTTAACLLVAVTASIVMTPKYTATATLLIDFQDPVETTTSGPQQQLAALLQPNYLTTQLGIIVSRNVAARVVDEQNLTASPFWKAAYADATDPTTLRNRFLNLFKGPSGGGTGSIREWIIGQLVDPSVIQAVAGTGSRLVQVSLTVPDRQMSARVANGFARAYNEINLEMSTEPAGREAAHNEVALKVLREKLEQAQARLGAYQRETGIVLEDEKMDVEIDRLKDIDAARVKAEGDLKTTEAKAAQIAELRARGRPLDALPDVLASNVVRDLKARLAEKEADFADIARQLGRNHPQYRSTAAEIGSLRSQLNQEVAAIVNGTEHEAQQLRGRLNSLAAAEEQQKAKVLALKKERDRLPALEHDLTAAQTNYDQALARSNLYLVQSGQTQTNVTVVDPAQAPVKPSSPNWPLNLVLALVLGMVIGVGISLLRELSDRRVRGGKELEAVVAAPLLGSLPSDGP